MSNLKFYENNNGKTLICIGVGVLEVDGLYFKDYAGDGKLLPYADHRLSNEIRAQDLVNRMTVDEMLGLMLHSAHQTIPALPRTMMDQGMYNGLEFSESGANSWDLTDQQKKMIKQEHLRHLLATNYQDIETAVKWNNNLQRCAEATRLGIPVNISSDPRHGSGGDGVEFKSAEIPVSKWPEGIGMAATFDAEVARKYANIVSKEYRALGIATALGPQIDLATDPRWFRLNDTYGSHAKLVADLAKATCNGFQTTKQSLDGWGAESIVAMAKHWPGGGSGEGGRDAHYPFGKYAVYPGGNFEEHLIPFTEGAFKLDETKCCAAIMPYYNIPWGVGVENVAQAYNEYIIKDLLLEKYQYEGVVCTDWNITPDMTPSVGMYVMGGKPHGVEELSVAERYLKLMMNGVNQIACIDKADDIKKAYVLGCEKFGESAITEKVKISAFKTLLNMFRLGLFENPYLDVSESLTVIGCEAHLQAGFEAQLKSIIMLKNKNNVLPLRKHIKVYSPDRFIGKKTNFIRFEDDEKQIETVISSEYFEQVATPEEADVAIVFVENPLGNNGFEMEELKAGESGYSPISLQYRPYTAQHARENSIAGGDPREENPDRNYFGKSTTTANESDLDNVIAMKEKMNGKPVIVSMTVRNPAVMAELEPYADAILVEFGISKKAVYEVLTGGYEPSGLLPVQFPKDMETVEIHCEDVAFDIEAYSDELGHKYQFGFGMNYSGQIDDARTRKYRIN